MKNEGSRIDPKLIERRRRNKIASAKCRDKKVQEARQLREAVMDLQRKVEEKREHLRQIRAGIELKKQFFLENERFLNLEEQKKLVRLLAEFELVKLLVQSEM